MVQYYFKITRSVWMVGWMLENVIVSVADFDF